MVVAAGRWFAFRVDLLAALLIGAVALSAILVSQDAGWYCLVCLVTFRNDQEKSA